MPLILQVSISEAMRPQVVDDGLEVEFCIADPVGQDCAVQIKARTGEDLALTV